MSSPLPIPPNNRLLIRTHLEDKRTYAVYMMGRNKGLRSLAIGYFLYKPTLLFFLQLVEVIIQGRYVFFETFTETRILDDLAHFG